MARAPYGPTQLRILKVLGDGKPHPRTEIVERCFSESGSANTLPMQISLMRKKLAKECDNGSTLNVVLVYGTEDVTYQLVRIEPVTIDSVKSLQ